LLCPSMPHLLHEPRLPSSPLFPYTTLFRSRADRAPTIAGPRTDRPDGSRLLGRHLPAPRGGHGLAPAGWRQPGRQVRERREDERSEEHTSELQSRVDLVCRLLLEKKKRRHTNKNHTKIKINNHNSTYKTTNTNNKQDVQQHTCQDTISLHSKTQNSHTTTQSLQHE